MVDRGQEGRDESLSSQEEEEEEKPMEKEQLEVQEEVIEEKVEFKKRDKEVCGRFLDKMGTAREVEGRARSESDLVHEFSRCELQLCNLFFKTALTQKGEQ